MSKVVGVDAVLTVHQLVAGYGDMGGRQDGGTAEGSYARGRNRGASPQRAVLQGLDFSIAPGETVAVLGRNGSGRSTLAKVLVGLLPFQGEVVFQGRSLAKLAPHQIARLGLAYVPETRDVFPTLTVHQNLLLGQLEPGSEATNGLAKRALEWVYAMFPRLAERRHTPGGVLSGGEQQMLSLGRALLGNPRLLVVDEPTEGLAPKAVAEVATCLRAVQQDGCAILLIEQKLPTAFALAQRVMVLGQGKVQFAGTPDALQANPTVLRDWLEANA
jgi:branched-chain amino acid transport system ATP-binding protein